MPFDRPGLAVLDERLAADIESRLPGTDPKLRRSLLGILARAVAGAHHELYGYLDWIARQAFPDTADAAELDRWSRIWGVQRLAATRAAGTVWRAESGAEYETASEVTIADGGALRLRLLFRIQSPPRAGTADDYVMWARAAHPDVTRAWATPLASGLGTVTVHFMTDAATGDGVPTTTVVDAVQDDIDARRPVTAAVTVSAPTAVALDVTIGSLVPDTAAVRAAIQGEIKDLILRESAPGATILISHIREAISAAADETDHVLTSPTADVDHAAAEIAVEGTFTWPS